MSENSKTDAMMLKTLFIREDLHQKGCVFTGGYLQPFPRIQITASSYRELLAHTITSSWMRRR